MGNLYRRRRGGGGGGGGSSIDLNLALNSVDAAWFAFDVLFAIWALALALRCLRIVRTRTRGMHVHVLLHVIVFFAVTFSLTADALDAAYAALANNLNAVDSLGPTPELILMLEWTFDQADILFAVAFLAFIFFAYRTLHGVALPGWKLALDGTLVCAWTAVMIAFLVAYSEVLSFTWTITGPSDEAAFRTKLKTFRDLMWAMYALQIATTLDVVASAAWLRLQARKTEYSDKVCVLAVLNFIVFFLRPHRFDETQTATYLALATAPLFLIRALFWLAINIVAFEEASSFTFDFDALSLAVVIVNGLLLYVAISAFLAGGTVQEKQIKSMQNV